MNVRRTLAAAVAAVAVTMTLAACGGEEAKPDGGGEGFNEADVDFASDMIQHHAQALEMVDLTDERTLDPKVKKLAGEIRAAQAPEIEQMTDLLDEWGEEIPETSRDHANAHGDGTEMDHDMPGMMSTDEMSALEEAPDAEFQDMFLEMMTKHHEGAVEMAVTEIETGENSRAITLAEDIADAQEEEIEEMKDLLGS